MKCFGGNTHRIYDRSARAARPKRAEKLVKRVDFHEPICTDMGAKPAEFRVRCEQDNLHGAPQGDRVSA
jgi:hypothetical protein